jgi:hypothetical protein
MMSIRLPSSPSSLDSRYSPSLKFRTWNSEIDNKLFSLCVVIMQICVSSREEAIILFALLSIEKHKYLYEIER